MSTVKEITAYDFAGTIYRYKRDAVQAEILLDIREFLQPKIGFSDTDKVMKLINEDFDHLFFDLLKKLY